LFSKDKIVIFIPHTHRSLHIAGQETLQHLSCIQLLYLLLPGYSCSADLMMLPHLKHCAGVLHYLIKTYLAVPLVHISFHRNASRNHSRIYQLILCQMLQNLHKKVTKTFCIMHNILQNRPKIIFPSTFHTCSTYKK